MRHSAHVATDINIRLTVVDARAQGTSKASLAPPLGFDVGGFSGTSSSRTPAEKIIVSTRRIRVAADPALSVAFSSARKSTVLDEYVKAPIEPQFRE